MGSSLSILAQGVPYICTPGQHSHRFGSFGRADKAGRRTACEFTGDAKAANRSLLH